MQNLLLLTLEELTSRPIAHVAVLLPDVIDDKAAPTSWFCFVRCTAGALNGAVLVFDIGMALFPHQSPVFTCLTPLEGLSDTVNDGIKRLTAAYTATTPLRSMLVELKHLLTHIPSEGEAAATGAAVAKRSRSEFEAQFADVFLPSDELEALVGTIEQRSVLQDSQSFLTASQLFMSQSGMDISKSWVGGE